MMFHDCILVLTGATLAFYWGKVIEMAIRSRRRAGRSANFVPREPVGRMLRIIWIPAVCAWVAAPFLAVFTHSKFLAPLHQNTVISLTALVLCLAAMYATLRCWRRMGRAWRMGIDPGERNPLVTTGPFGIVRHPIYALSTGLCCASAIGVCSPLILVAAAIHLPLLQWESLREEKHMLGIYGTDYQQYCRKVGRFLPRVKLLSRGTPEAA
jgi:protein-S-isoprenylcysteine O-methyltransferase Ste14